MNKKGNILYGIGTMTIIAICVWFYYGYVYPRLPEDYAISTSYMTGNYRELDSMAIYNGEVDTISCFEYTLPQTYNFGYNLILANRYSDIYDSFCFFEKLVCLTKEREWDYSDTNINDALEKMDGRLRIIALRHLAHSERFYKQDSIRFGKFAPLYDSIYTQEHQGMKGGDNE